MKVRLELADGRVRCRWVASMEPGPEELIAELEEDFGRCSECGATTSTPRRFTRTSDRAADGATIYREQEGPDGE